MTLWSTLRLPLDPPNTSDLLWLLCETLVSRWNSRCFSSLEYSWPIWDTLLGQVAWKEPLIHLKLYATLKSTTAVAGLKFFLGFCNVFWKFGSDLTGVSVPLNKMLWNNQPVKLGQLDHENTTAVKALQDKSTSPHVLAFSVAMVNIHRILTFTTSKSAVYSYEGNNSEQINLLDFDRALWMTQSARMIEHTANATQ